MSLDADFKFLVTDLNILNVYVPTKNNTPAFISTKKKHFELRFVTALCTLSVFECMFNGGLSASTL